MPAPQPPPLTWDSPLPITWDADPNLATWDGMAPGMGPAKKKNAMTNNTKAIIDFSSYPAAELGPLATHIHTRITANVATFATPTVTLAALLTLITTYNTKLSARASKATADALAFNESREALETALASLGGYVNDIAQGDPLIVELSGFPSYVTSKTPDYSAPGAPTNLRLRHGDVTGAIVARYKTQRQPSTNEVQTNTGNPMLGADWHTVGMFMGQKADLTGLTPGTIVWVRVRTVGLRNVMGDWSDPAQIMVM
jgi:hypothetical protein